MKDAEAHVKWHKWRNLQDECDVTKTNWKAVTKPGALTEPQKATNWNKLLMNQAYRVCKWT